MITRRDARRSIVSAKAVRRVLRCPGRASSYGPREPRSEALTATTVWPRSRLVSGDYVEPPDEAEAVGVIPPSPATAEAFTQA